MGEKISHEGIVINTAEGGLTEIEITAGSACSACHARSACPAGSTERKIITVRSVPEVNKGDHVTVVMEQSHGYLALALGYLFPFIVLVTAFILLSAAGAGELASALLSFAAVAVYYIVIWLFRSAVDRKFDIKIKV